MQGPKFMADRIECERDGEEITLWNQITVEQHHDIGPTDIQSHHEVWAGDGSTRERPTYITPAIDEQLMRVDVYANAEVVDPTNEGITVL
jgi:hypothetical protein